MPKYMEPRDDRESPTLWLPMAGERERLDQAGEGVAVPRARWTNRRAILFVLALAAAVRLLAMGSLPLLITEDGVDYLRVGEAIADWLGRVEGAAWPEIAVVRTPGYPAFIGLILFVFGKGPAGILLVQHAMGVGIAGIVAWATARLAGDKFGPWLVTIVGTLVAIDPWLIACESFLLTEASSAFFVVIPAACALVWRRATFARGLLIGTCVACAIHIRPACQVLVPFFVGAAMLAGFEGWRRLARWREAVAPAIRCGLGAALALSAILGPWLWFNFAKRDVRGMAQGFDTQLWIYYWKEGLVDDREMPEEFREAFLKAGLDKILPQQKRAYEFLPFIAEINAWNDVSVGKKLSTWAKAAAARQPDKYAQRFWTALRTQLNWHTDAPYMLWEELPGFVHALGKGREVDPAAGRPPLPKNFAVYQEREGMKPYAMETDAGLLGSFLRWYARHHPEGTPYVGLFVVGILACVAALVRGRWGIGLIFCGAMGSIVLYAVMVAIFARYGVPYWMVLYLAPAAFVSACRKSVGEAGDLLATVAAPPSTPEPINKRPI